MRPLLLLLLALVLPLAGCAGGPSYAGGPTEEDPHGVVIPGEDVFIYRVDGHDVDSRSSPTYVEPGRRRIRVRFQYDIDSESATPQEYKELELTVEPGDVFLIERTGEGQWGPFDVEVKRAPRG